MPDQYLTLATALFSAALGCGVALLGVLLTNRANVVRLKLQLDHQSNQRKAELLRERGEELYELIDKWLNGLTGYYLRRASVMQGKLTYNQCLELEIQEGRESAVNFGRISMLIDVYFPSTRAAYDRVIAARTELNKVATAHKHAYAGGDIDGSRFLTPFVRAQEAIEELGEVLQKKVLECVRTV